MRAVVLVLGAAGALAACGPTSPGPEGSCKESLLAGDLVITEIFADFQGVNGGSSTDEGKEWIEIYNASDRPLDLAGLTVVHGRPDGSRQKSHVLESITIAPGQYFTMGNATQDLLPAYVDYGYGADLGEMFNTNGGKIDLKCGGAEIDSAIYDMVEAGHSRQLTAGQAPDYTLNDDPASWCGASETEFEPGNFGTPGQDNDCTPVIIGQCNEGGTMRATVSPGPGDLVITEVMPSPSAVDDAVGEWFEVRALRDVDLNGLGLDRAGDSTAKPDLVEATNCLHLAAGDHAVFARSADSTLNGGLRVAGTFKFTLVGGSASAPGDVRILAGDTLIDSVSWTSSRNGRSLSLDPDSTSDTANDDPANFCDGATVYNSAGTTMDYGTPGAENPQCGSQPGTGQCMENGAPRAIVKPGAGQLVITEFLANPVGTDTDTEWFEIANVGNGAFDLNGLGLKGNATTVNVITSADCKRVPAGGFALFARNADPTLNGKLPAVDATFSFSLVQSNGTISVLDGTTPLDVITWTTGIVEGASKQLQPNQTTTTANDDPANFCNASAGQVYGSLANLGTPKAVNACP